MDAGAPKDAKAAKFARKWLEDSSASGIEAVRGGGDAVWSGGFNALPLVGLRVSNVGHGRVLCALRIPAHLTDAEGNWQAGAIAAAMDDVCAAAIASAEGVINISVQFDISYFSSAKFDEEVEMEGWVVARKGNLTAAAVEARRKATGELVAVGRQWMSASRPKGSKPSKL